MCNMIIDRHDMTAKLVESFFSGTRDRFQTDYVLHGQVLESLTFTVDISCSLAWNSHVDHITANAN